MNILQKFDQISRSPEYQGASDLDRDNIRQNLFWDELAPKLDLSEIEEIKAKYDKMTAPEGDPTAGTLEDVGRSFASGIVAPIGDMARFPTAGAPNAISSAIEGFNKDIQHGRSPTAIQSERNTGLQFNPDTGGIEIKPDSSLYGLAMQLSGAGGSMVSSIGTGVGFGKAIQLTGKGLGAAAGVGTANTASAAIKAGNFTKARQALATSISREQTANRIGFGMTGATMIGGGTGKQAYEETLFRTGSVALAEAAGEQGTLTGGALGSMTMGLAGPIEQRLLMGRGGATRWGNAAKGAGIETVQEFFESGGQEYLAGKAMRDIGLEVEDLVGRSLAVGFHGAALGAVAGGALGGLSKPQKQYTQQEYDQAIEANNLEATRLEGELNTGNLTDEQRGEHEKKLTDIYRAVAIDEIAKSAARPAVEDDQAGESSAAQSQDADVADPGERRIPRQDWLPTNMSERYQNSIEERRGLVSQLRRAAQNGIADSGLKQYEDRIRAQDELINTNRIAVNNAGNQKYFANSQDFYAWLNRAARGANWEELALMELEARKGRPVDWPAMAQMEQNILQQGDIRDRARVLELNGIVQAVEERMAQSRINPQAGMEAAREIGEQKLEKRQKAAEQREQRRQARQEGRAQERAHAEEQRRQVEQEQIEAERIRKQQKQKADREAAELQKHIDAEHWTDHKIGPYHVWAGKSDTFAVSGTTKPESSKMHALGGFFDKDSNSWEFPKNKRQAVKDALQEMAKKPQPKEKAKRKRVYPKTVRKRTRRARSQGREHGQGEFKALGGIEAALKPAFPNYSATHVWRNPETGKDELLIQSDKDWYTDQEGDDRFLTHRSGVKPVAAHQEEINRQKEEERKQQEEEAEHYRKKKAEQDVINEKERKKYDEQKAQEDREREESEQWRKQHEEEQKQWERNKKLREEQEEKDIQELIKTREFIDARADEISGHPEFTPNQEIVPWADLSGKVPDRTGNTKARSITWARILEDAYKKTEGWNSRLLYADENVAVFKAPRDKLFVVKQTEAYKYLAWAEVSGKSAASPDLRTKQPKEALKENFGVAYHGDSYRGYGTQYDIINGQERDAWKGGWRGAVTRPVNKIKKAREKAEAKKEEKPKPQESDAQTSTKPENVSPSEKPAQKTPESKPTKKPMTMADWAESQVENSIVPIPFNLPTIKDGKSLILKNQKSDVVVVQHRPMVALEINGHIFPFYASTGYGGKQDVPTSKWYPFFGVGNDGWINKLKGKQMTAYYGSIELRALSEALDKKYPRPTESKKYPSASDAEEIYLDVINRDLNPTMNGLDDTFTSVVKNIKTADRRLQTATGRYKPEQKKTPKLIQDPKGLTHNELISAMEKGANARRKIKEVMPPANVDYLRDFVATSQEPTLENIKNFLPDRLGYKDTIAAELQENYHLEVAIQNEAIAREEYKSRPTITPTPAPIKRLKEEPAEQAAVPVHEDKSIPELQRQGYELEGSYSTGDFEPALQSINRRANKDPDYDYVVVKGGYERFGQSYAVLKRHKDESQRPKPKYESGDRVKTRYSFGTVKKVGRKYAEVVDDFTGMVGKELIEKLSFLSQGDRAEELQLISDRFDDLIRKALENPSNWEASAGDLAKFIINKAKNLDSFPLRNSNQLRGLLQDEGIEVKGWLSKQIKAIKAEMNPPQVSSEDHYRKDFSNTEGDLSTLTLENLTAIAEKEKFGLKSIMQRIGEHPITNPKDALGKIRSHLERYKNFPVSIKQKLKEQLDQDEYATQLKTKDLTDNEKQWLTKNVSNWFNAGQHHYELKFIASEAKRDRTLSDQQKQQKQQNAENAESVESPATTALNDLPGDYKTLQNEVYKALKAGKRIATNEDVVWVENTGQGWIHKKQAVTGGFVHTKGGAGANTWSQEEAIRNITQDIEYDIREVADARPSAPETTVTPAETESASGASPAEQPTARQTRKRRRTGKLIEIDDELNRAADEFAKELRKGMGSVSSGVDPVLLAKFLQHGIKTSSLLIQKGAIKFADWADNMLAIMEDRGFDPEQIAPYLKRVYMATSVEDDIEHLADQMDDRKRVKNFDMDKLLNTETAYTAEELDADVVNAALDAGRNTSTGKRWAGSTQGEAKVTTGIMDYLFSHGPEDMTQSDIEDIGRELKDRLVVEEEVVRELVDSGATHNQEFKRKVLDNPDDQNSRLAIQKLVKEAGLDFRRMYRDEGIESAKEKYAIWAKNIDKEAVVDRVMDYRDTWRNAESTGKENETGSQSSDESLEGVSSSKVPKTQTGRNTGAGSGNNGSQVLREDDGAGGTGVQSSGGKGNSTKGTDLRTAGERGSGEVTERSGGVNTGASDYTITPDIAESIAGGSNANFSPVQRFDDNISAIQLVKELGERPATVEQQAILAKYVGWGGLQAAFPDATGHAAKGWEKRAKQLKALLTEEEYEAAFDSTPNAHYTTPAVINSIYQALNHFGAAYGRVLEPSVGVGNFIGLMPGEMRGKSNIVAVEKDIISGRIASKLYPSSKISTPQTFEKFDLANNSFDIVVANPPFGSVTITDNKRKHLSGRRIHNYFLAKSLEALRPGGIMGVVVSKGFMDSSKNLKGLESTYRNADLLGAFRLPGDAFRANANTDVTTDILFFQKRDKSRTEKELEKANPNDFRTLRNFTGADGSTVTINEYFVKNPSHILGDTITSETGMYGPGARMVVVSRPDLDWTAALKEKIDALKGEIYSPEQNVVFDLQEETATDVHNADVGGLYFDNDGNLKRREADQEGVVVGSPVTGYTNQQGKFIAYKSGDFKKLEKLTELARVARKLIRSQVIDHTDAELQPLRDELNRRYDAFVKSHNALNRDNNKRLIINADPTVSPMLLALEAKYQKPITKAVAERTGQKMANEKATKAEIFSRRTQTPYRPVTKASNPDDALVATLAETGRVHLVHMSRLSGKSEVELYSALKGKIYFDPSSGFVTKDEYLSGNVKEKLRQAKELQAIAEGHETAKELDTDFSENVTALEQVIPDDIAPEDIAVSIGSVWQTPQLIEDFWQELFGDTSKAKVSFIPALNSWNFSGEVNRDDLLKRWGTSGITPAKMFDKILNNKQVVVKRKDADGKTHTDKKATDAANLKVQEIGRRFSEWLWEDAGRREKYGRIYNDMMNTTVNRTYDGSHLSFPGQISDDVIKLRETQSNAIWRIVQSKTTLLDHVVGAGKTFTMIGAAMEMRRMGLAKKPVFVVPNHLVEQWAADFALLYPNSKVLAATGKNFGKHKRRGIFAQIATGDWDAVIVSHTSFGKLPSDPEAEESFLTQQLQDLTRSEVAMRNDSGGDTRSTKQLADAKNRMKQNLEKLKENTSKDQGLTLQELGIDALFVDEAHEFKNLEFFTSMDRVKNINPAGSQKSSDLFIKIQSILGRTNGRNIVFATGTPVSNSMAELYTMQRYLGYQPLKDMGLAHFDAWAKQFGNIETKLERKPSGKYEPVSRFSRFINLPELMQQTMVFSDVINNDDIIKTLEKEGKGKHIPNIKGGGPQNVVADRSILQEGYMATIEARFADMPLDPRVDNPLKATNDARKAALDIRMINPDLPDFPSSKINKLVDRAFSVYQTWGEDKGTQLIFSDLSTPKGKNRNKAIEEIRGKLQELVIKDKDAHKNHEAMALIIRIRDEPADNLYNLLLDMSVYPNVDQDKALTLIEKTNPDEIESLGARFDAYNDIKEKLINRGVPEHEIAFIHDANTDAQKEELFAKVNSGQVRFLLGSTAKMGAGTNVQERLVALHHLDAPWRPSDLVQREGRIVRQGNQLYLRDPKTFEIEILRYGTERTYDVNMWQTLETKARFIQQVRNGTAGVRQAEDIGSEAANAAEMKAASSGDPRILEQVEVQQRLAVLESERRSHQRDKTTLARNIDYKKSLLEETERRIASIEKETAKVEPIKKDQDGKPIPPYITKSGKTFKTTSDAIEALEKAIKTNKTSIEQTLGTYRGFTIKAEVENGTRILEDKGKIKEIKIKELYLWVEGDSDHSIYTGDDVSNKEKRKSIDLPGVFTRINNALDVKMEKKLQQEKRRRENIPKEIQGLKDLREAPFTYEKEYQQKVQRNQELVEQLGSKESVNEPATTLPEYQLLSDVHDSYLLSGSEDGITEKNLISLAMRRRVSDLKDKIKYSHPTQEHEVAYQTIKEAVKQNTRGIRRSHVEQAFSRMKKARQEGRSRQDQAGRTTKGYTLQEPAVYAKSPQPATNQPGLSVDDAEKFALARLAELGVDSSTIKLMVDKNAKEFYGQNTTHNFDAALTGIEGEDTPVLLLSADRHQTDADVRRTIDHEIIGHLGLAKFFTEKEKVALLKQIKNSQYILKQAWDHVRKNYPDKDFTSDIQAEEVLTYIAERPQWDNSRWRKIVSFIVEKLQSHGLFTGYTTHKQIESILASIVNSYKQGDQGKSHIGVSSNVGNMYFGSQVNPRDRYSKPPAFYRLSQSGQETRGETEQDSIKKVVSDLVKLDKDAVSRLAANTQGTWRRVKGSMLGALGGRQIADIYGPLFKKFTDAGVLSTNPITTISNLMQGMQALRNDWVHKAEKIDQRWARLARQDKRRYQDTAKLMYESTLTGIDPRLPFKPEKKRTEHTRAKYIEDYQRVEALWSSLSPTAQQLYTDVEQHYKNQYKATQKAMIERAKGLFEPREAHEAIQKLKQQFGSLKGPYFPLMRHGDYYVKGIDAEGKEYREHFEKEGEYLAAKKQLQDQGMTITEDGKIAPYEGSDTSGVMPFVVKMEKRLLKDTDSQFSRREKMKFLDELHQASLAMLPDTSAAKRSMHRRKIAGYDSNARRAFNSTALTGSNRLARVTYGWQVEEALKKMREATKNNAKTRALTDQQNIVAQDVITELKKRHDLNMNPNTHAASAFATNFAFLTYLGGSLGAGLINLTQTPLLALPVLGGRYGYRRTSRYMAKASADYFGKGKRKFADTTDFMTNAWFTLEGNQKLSDDERALIQTLIDDGTIETTQASSMAGNAGVDLDQPRAVNRDWYNNLVRGSGIWFHNAEVANRQITALAAYRLWRDAQLKNKPSGHILTSADIAKGAAFARKATFDSHFDYSNYNRPRYMKGNWARVFLIFKQYSQNMAYLLGRTFYNATKNKALSKEERTVARRQMAGILGLSTMASGLMGLPGIALLTWFAEAVGGDEDDPYDAEVEFRKYLAGLFGKDVAHALSKGVANGFLGIDLHSRVKLSDMFYQSDNRDLSPRDEALGTMATVSGPFFSYLINSWVGLNEVMEGDGWRGMERMMPKFIRDGMRTIRYNDEGLVDASGNVMVEDFSLYEKAWRTIGIGSAKESEAWEARSAVKGYQSHIGRRRSTLLNDYDKARRENDQDALQRVMEQIGGFNAARRINDQPKLMISGKTLSQSTRTRERRRKQTEKGIYLPSSQLGMRDLTTGYVY